MSDTCFQSCVDNFNGRVLDEDESHCVEGCSAKFIKYNKRLITCFVKMQSIAVNKRIEEATQQQVAENT